VGTLAGGLAHDLNNILAPIMVSVRLLERKLAHDPEGLECVAMLEQLASRGANIVRQVLSFARGVEGDRVPTPIRHIVHEVVDVLRETLPRSITVRETSPRDLWSARADATQIHQVLMNLAVNARDAMPAGGTLGITAENVTLDPHFAQMHAEAHPGRYVSISVTDTGTGIAPSTSTASSIHSSRRSRRARAPALDSRLRSGSFERTRGSSTSTASRAAAAASRSTCRPSSARPRSLRRKRRHYCRRGTAS
jgi:C4-dicarboxylate-specific signal transduction histidine kinase